MTYWNHTTHTGLFEGRTRGQSAPYQEGDWVEHLLARSATDGVPEGTSATPRGPSTNIGPGQEDLGVYPGQDTNPTAPDLYYRLDDVTPYLFQLVGPEFQAGTTVDRTHNWVSLSIDEIYERKVQEIGAYDQQVRYNAVDSSLSANWWVVVTMPMRFELLGIATASNSRELKGQGWPTGPNAPWVGIYNAATEEAKRYQITDKTDQWDVIEQEVVLHDQATGNATDLSRSTLDTNYGNNDIDAVRNHDPADPTWGYPSTVSLSEEARALLG